VQTLSGLPRASATGVSEETLVPKTVLEGGNLDQHRKSPELKHFFTRMDRAIAGEDEPSSQESIKGTMEQRKGDALQIKTWKEGRARGSRPGEIIKGRRLA